MHLVTGIYFRSRKKDGGHTNRSGVGENPALHADFTVLCVRRRVIAILAMEFLHYAKADLSWHAGIRGVCTCYGPCSVLWPWPWPDDLHIQTWPAVHGDTPDVQIWTSYVKSIESYRQTDRQTDLRPRKEIKSTLFMDHNRRCDRAKDNFSRWRWRQNVSIAVVAERRG